MGFFVTGAPEGSIGRLVLIDVFGEARGRPCDPWFTRRVAFPLHHGGIDVADTKIISAMLYLSRNYDGTQFKTFKVCNLHIPIICSAAKV